jgi:uncharacterized protein YndB with AHSA1/START domain
MPAEMRAIVEQNTEIDAPPAVVFDAILEEMTALPGRDGQSMNLKLEKWPGGRWYRDLGNNTGHLWGHVQVIKPPTLLEIYGPLMISTAAINHLTYRITERGGKSHLALTHRIVGDFDPKLPQDVKGGWGMFLDRVKARAGKGR